MPCPHCDVKILQRSKGQTSVASAAAQSGKRLFSEYDQKQKYYSHKSEIVHTEILLPPHAPPEYADRNTLWNAAEAAEKQWNSQLARRFVLAIPRELSPEQYADLIRDYCREFFVSKGMIADFAIHDKEDTVDWNDQKYGEIWRQGWADTANRYLEAAGRPERLDLRSYERQGLDKLPTVHLGPAASQMEKRGIKTNIGNLNRDIKEANRLIQSIRQMVRNLKGWLSDLKEKKDALLEAMQGTREPTLPELLSDYLDLRREERTGWTGKGQLKGSVADFNKVMEAVRYLREKELSTVEQLDAYLDKASQQAVSIQEKVKEKKAKIKKIDAMLSHIANYEAYKPIHTEYAALKFKKTREPYAAAHKKELDAYYNAVRYFKNHLKGEKYSTKKLNAEREGLAGEVSGYKDALGAIQEDVKILRDVRRWLNQVLPPEQYRQAVAPGEQPSIQEEIRERQERARREQARKRTPPHPQRKQDMEL